MTLLVFKLKAAYQSIRLFAGFTISIGVSSCYKLIYHISAVALIMVG